MDKYERRNNRNREISQNTNGSNRQNNIRMQQESTYGSDTLRGTHISGDQKNSRLSKLFIRNDQKSGELLNNTNSGKYMDHLLVN